MKIVDFMESIASHLLRYRYRWRSESDLQVAVLAAFDEGEWEVEREYVLNEKSRVDFYVHVPGESRLAVELKTQGRDSSVARQVARYAACPNVDGVLLVTTSTRLAKGLPGLLSGKPTRAVVLTGGTL